METASEVNLSRAAVELADLELIESTDNHIDNFENIPVELLSQNIDSSSEKVVKSKTG